MKAARWIYEWIVKPSVLGFMLLCTATLIKFYTEHVALSDASRVDLGYPFRFYSSFQLNGNPYFNHGGSVDALLLDFLVFYVVVILFKLLTILIKK